MQSDANTKSKAGYLPLFRSYLGFLEGTGKSRATISSYKTDLEIFAGFLQKRKFDFFEMRPGDFEIYMDHLKRLGLKTNTRRRKLLTVRSLYRYALTRKKIRVSPAQFVRAPERLERLPWIPKKEEIGKLLDTLPKDSLTALRDRVLVQLLLETGLPVAELCLLTWEQLEGRLLQVKGKKPRSLRLSAELVKELKLWRAKAKGKFLFPGFNRYGIHTPKMTPRGVELVFRMLAKRSGLPKMKPKTLRHYATMEWLRNKVPDTEIQRRLGVSATYLLDAYRRFLADHG